MVSKSFFALLGFFFAALVFVLPPNIALAQFLAAPTLLSPGDGDTVPNITPTLDWGDVAGAVAYYVNLNDPTWNKIVSTSQVQVDAGVLTAGGTSKWRVRACSDADCSVFHTWSNGGTYWNFTVAAAAPILNIPPGSLSFVFSATAGGPPSAFEFLEIRNTGGGALNWTMSVAPPIATWLKITPPLSSVNPLTAAMGLDGRALQADPAGFAAGPYNATITVAATDASTGLPIGIKNVSVTFTVTPAGGVGTFTVGSISPISATEGVAKNFSAEITVDATADPVVACAFWVDGSSVGGMVNALTGNSFSVNPCASGSTCTAIMNYTFPSAGAYPAYARCSSVSRTVSGTPVSITVTPAGGAPIALSPAGGLAFGNQTVGTVSLPKTLTITNTSASNVTITSITSSNPVFQIPLGPWPLLAPGATLNVAITFSPTALVSYNETVIVQTPGVLAPIIVTAPVSGTGVAAGAPTVDLKANGSDGPITVPSGSSVMLTWTTTGSPTTCTAAGPSWSGSKSTSGGSESVVVSSSGNWVLACVNALGSGSDLVAVTVAAGGPGPSAGVFTFPNPLGATSFTDLINTLINFLFTLAVIVAPILLVIAGVIFMTAAGDPGRVKTARSMLLWTIVGFGIILISKGLVEVLKGILGL